MVGPAPATPQPLISFSLSLYYFPQFSKHRVKSDQMVSNKPSDHASKSKKSHGGQGSDVLATLTYRINQLKKQIQADRILSIEEKHEENRKKLENQVSELVSLAASRKDMSTAENNTSGKMLSRRMESPLCRISSFIQGSGDRDCVSGEEVVSPTTAKLPLIEKIPPYTTWIFLDRNQRMAEDQSVVGRRRIYYDQRGSEALICSDSEEEISEVEEERHEFSEGEDRILQMVIQDFELSEEVLKILIQFVRGSTSGIQERCNLLKEKNEDRQDENLKVSEECGFVGGISREKSLSSALDSFDNLFCRRCLVFDCRLHGCSQSLVYPTEKKSYSSDSEDDGKPCSDQCYLQVQVAEGLTESSVMDQMNGSESKSLDQEGLTLASANPQESEHHDESLGKRKASETIITTSNSKPGADGIQVSCSKKLKSSVPDAIATEGNPSLHHSSIESRVEELARSSESEVHTITENSTNIACENDLDKFAGFNLSGNKIEENIRDEGEGITEVCESKWESSSKANLAKDLFRKWDWKPLERELYLKGIEIYGRNSCLIARNLLSGLKTCIEVSSYMNDGGAATPRGSVKPCSYSEDYGRTDIDHTDLEMLPRTRLLRKRGRTRKFKYSTKSAGHPLIWRRIADGKNQSCKQYNPCGCQSMCGKQCPCLQNGTCCEKYCGCLKTCKNRFRGCHCAKSQCRSRQCPCFAAGRECDPDVCRNCWVSCGDGSLGEPPRQGDGQCGNMRLLLRQQQRILLAKSDVAGWGAFLKNPVNKNDYLGEYTGELISHREADKRGKIYDRANSSFLFDLNDQYVLDAYRKGDKLKFANHSSNPNCYAKVMLVAGDHRVGIFAKERIEGSEEIFYDYRYGPDQAPIWARKPEDSKRDDSPATQVRARKHQSH